MKYISKKTKFISIAAAFLLTLFWFSNAKSANTGMYTEADPIYKAFEILKFSDVFRGYIYSILFDSFGVFEKVSYQWTSYTWLLFVFENPEKIQYVNAGIFIYPAMFFQLLLPTGMELSKQFRKWIGMIALLLVIAVVSVGFLMWSPKDQPDTAHSLQARYFIIPWLLTGVCGNLWNGLSKKYPQLQTVDLTSYLEKYTIIFSIFFFIQGAVGQLVRYYTIF